MVELLGRTRPCAHGSKVLATLPALISPFADASELAVESSTEARICKANGFGSHGEPAKLVLGADGKPITLLLGGAELLPEQTFVDELAERTGAARSSLTREL
jgi:D-alanyl-D-alanine carboxypeptidase